MKQKDILTIVLVAIVSGIVSLVISSKVFNTPQNRQQEVEVVPAISVVFPQPSTQYFNSKSIDPIQIIRISNNNNTQPFGSQ